jgi:hypothetical protein
MPNQPEVPALQFPGRILKAGSGDKTSIETLQLRLNEVGCGPIDETGVFNKSTKNSVMLFQARFSDVDGLPLVVDGQVGPLTWAALFGARFVPSTSVVAPSVLVGAAIEFAVTQIGVMESPLGSNRGPEVDKYLRAVKLDPAADSFPWCVAFTHFCYKMAAESSGGENPHTRTAGVLDHWAKAAQNPAARRVLKNQAVANPALVRPGSLFIIDVGEGAGHSGMVVGTANGRLSTIEGNTNNNGSRNGIGVFRREARKIMEINKGFIDYGGD